MDIQFSGQITKDQLAQILRLGNPIRKLLIVIWFILLFFLIANFFLSWGNLGSIGLYLLFPFSVIFLGLYWVLSPSISAARLFKQNPQLKEPISGVVSKTGVSLNTYKSVVEHKWKQYQTVRQSSDLVLLYYDKTSWNYFPRHFFKNDADWQEFLDLVAQNISGKKEIVKSTIPVVSVDKANQILYGSLGLMIVIVIISFLFQSV